MAGSVPRGNSAFRTVITLGEVMRTPSPLHCCGFPVWIQLSNEFEVRFIVQWPIAPCKPLRGGSLHVHI